MTHDNLDPSTELPLPSLSACFDGTSVHQKGNDKQWQRGNDKGAMTKVPTLALMTHEGEGATSQNSVDFIPAEGGHTEVAWKKVF